MKDNGPETIDDYIAWCRSGEPQRLKRKPRLETQERLRNPLTNCAQCGHRCHQQADHLCCKCRAAKKQHEQHHVLTDCTQCGRKCRPNPDGLCRYCRKKLKKGQPS